MTKKIKLKWTKGSIARDASQEEGPTVDIWTCEYEHLHAMIIPTSIIHGNDDFGGKDCGWVYFVREVYEWPERCFAYGYTSKSYKNPNAAKAAVRESIEMQFNHEPHSYYKRKSLKDVYKTEDFL